MQLYKLIILGLMVMVKAEAFIDERMIQSMVQEEFKTALSPAIIVVNPKSQSRFGESILASLTLPRIMITLSRSKHLENSPSNGHNKGGLKFYEVIDFDSLKRDSNNLLDHHAKNEQDQDPAILDDHQEHFKELIDKHGIDFYLQNHQNFLQRHLQQQNQGHNKNEHFKEFHEVHHEKFEINHELNPNLTQEGIGKEIRKQLHHNIGFGLVIHSHGRGNPGNHWFKIDELSMAFDKRLVILIDEFGKLISKIPKEINSRTILISYANTVTFFCPGKDLVSQTYFLNSSVEIDRFPTCPSPLKGKTPTITTVGGDPYLLSKSWTIDENQRLVRVPWKEEGTGNPYGVDYNMAQLIGQRFETNHFRLIRNPEFDHFNTVQGKWVGRAADVQSGKSDFSLGFAGIPGSAFDIADFTCYCYFTLVGFSSGHSKVITSLYNVVLPFSLITWMLILLVVVVTTAAFQLIYYVHVKKIKVHAITLDGSWDIPFQTLECLVEFRMTNFFAPHIHSARLLRGFYILFGTIMVMAYSNILRSALVTRIGDKTLDTVEDLAERGVPLAVPKGSEPDTFILQRKDEYPYNLIVNKLIRFDSGIKRNKKKHTGVQSTNDMYDKSFATITAKTTNLYMFYPWKKEEGYKRLHFSRSLMFTEFSYVLTKKGCSYKDEMKQFILRIHAAGFINHFLWKELPLEAKDFGAQLPAPDETPLTLETTALAFFLLIFGLLISFSFFIIEQNFSDHSWISPYPING